jgi:hypothetical protein
VYVNYNIREGVLLLKVYATLREECGLGEGREEHRTDCGSVHRPLLSHSPKRVNEYAYVWLVILLVTRPLIY